MGHKKMKMNKNIEDAVKSDNALKRIASFARKYDVARVENGIGYDADGNEVFTELTKEQEEYVKKEMHGWDSDINRIRNRDDIGSVRREQGRAVDKKIHINKFTGNGNLPLHESLIIGLVPKFVSLDKQTGIPSFKDTIDDVFIPGCNVNMQNPLPITFDSEEQFSHYLKLAETETLDSLFTLVETEFRKYVNVEEHYYPLLVGDTIWTWFQDRFGYTHYIIIVGDNGSGKNSALLLFKYLGYRVFYVVSASAANYYTKMGNIEEGQITIAEDEAEDIAEEREKRNVFKSGYCSGASVPKVELDGGRRSEDWLTYCQKWVAMEELPEDRSMKGILDRSVVLRFVIGDVPYNIKDVIRSAGDPKYVPLYNQLIHLRKLLFCFRLLHYDDTVLDVKLNVKNRTQELTKSLIRLFQDSPSALQRILDSLSKFMSERNEVKKNSIESKLYEVVTESIKERRAEVAMLPTNEEQRKMIEELRNLGESIFTNENIREKCKQLMEAEEVPNKVGLFYSPDLGTFSQSKITRILKSKFKAEPKVILLGGRTQRCLVFQQKFLDRIKTHYDIPEKIKILEPINENYRITQITDTMKVSPQNNANSVGKREHESNKKYDEFVPEKCNYRNSVINEDCKSIDSDKASKDEKSNGNVKCPKCSYETEPFYMKIHKMSAHINEIDD